MKAILLSIGDELALGQTVDTNSAWIAARLASLGVSTVLHETVSDDQPLIAAAIRWASTRADLVIVSGGLGPTQDDLTRQALADAMEVDLVTDEAALRTLEAFFASRGYEMAQRNRVQATHPVGAAMIPNPHGTAPGIAASLHDARIFVVPGVPREMRAMVEDAVLPALAPALRTTAPGVILTTKINTFGLGESDVAQRLDDLMRRDQNPTVGTTVAQGMCSVRLRAEFPDPEDARARLEATAAAVEKRLHPLAFGRDDELLPAALLELLKREKQTLATAESCTGGLIGAMLTDIPGSSAAYLGGWVTYTNALKTQQLGVSAAAIDAHGAVSEPVARAMAQGARERSGADLALAVTGIAGPDGGTPEKPVGTVWLALASSTQTLARCARFTGDRASIRDRATKCALQMARLSLMNETLDHLRWLSLAPAKPATA
ncbi:MAG: competence/damage-inducible protein A [Planctomycetota bacterium]